MADYTYDQVMAALRNADKAGDTAAAKRLAGIARDMKTEQPSGPNVTESAQARLDKNPRLGFEAVRAKSFPVLGAFADEIAGAAGMLSGKPYQEGRDEYNEMARLYQEQNPDSWAGTLGAVEGTVAAVGPAVKQTILSAPKAAGALYNTARGAVTGGAVGAAAGGLEGAGNAEQGDRVDGFLTGVKDGALFGAAGGAAAGAVLTGVSRGLQRFVRKSAERPTVEKLRAAKNAAYRAFEGAGEAFQPDEINSMIGRIDGMLDEAGYVGGFGQKTDQQLARLKKIASRGEPVSISALDDIRSRLWKSYRAAPDEVEILDIIREVDGLIDNKAGDAAKVAREANSRYRKAQLLESAFNKAEDQTAGSGSGGNIANKYKQAVTNIINSESKSRFFSEDEIAVMREFVRMDDSTLMKSLRSFGKLAPGGNGLMTSLNLFAAAVDPTALAATGAATAAKAASDSRVLRGAEAVQDMIATGQKPTGPAGVRVPSNVYRGVGVTAADD